MYEEDECELLNRIDDLAKENAQLKAENEGLSKKVKNLTAWYDKMFGAPCEEIRHQQQVEALEAERDQLKAELAEKTGQYNSSVQTRMAFREAYKRERDEVKKLKAELAQSREMLNGLGEWKIRLMCPMVAPSCLLCGQQRELVVKHIEVPVGVCEKCRSSQQREARLRDALQALCDVQNGPPLFKYEDAWNTAMALARTLLEEDKA